MQRFLANYRTMEETEEGTSPKRKKSKKIMWADHCSIGYSTGKTSEERDTNFTSLTTWKISPVGRLQGEQVQLAQYNTRPSSG